MSDTVLGAIENADVETLRSKVVEEYEACKDAAVSMMHHAVLCGKALTELRAEVTKTSAWYAWCDENLPITTAMAGHYMRIAKHADLVLESGVTTIRAARRLLTDTLDEGPPRYDQAVIVRALEMRGEGATFSAISEATGASKGTVRDWIDPKWRNHRAAVARARTAKARRALKQQDRQAAVRRKGQGIDVAYAHVRKALEALDRYREVLVDCNKRSARRAIGSLEGADDCIALAATSKSNQKALEAVGSAMSRLYEAEDSLVAEARNGTVSQVDANGKINRSGWKGQA